METPRTWIRLIGAIAVVTSLLQTPVNAEPLEPVQGLGCYAYGDDETPNQAKDKALARAREQAVSGYKVWVESVSQVEDFELKKDSIQSISVGMLQQVSIENMEKNRQEICVTIKAKIDPDSVEEEIDRRKQQRKIKEEVTSLELSPEGSLGVRIWFNKPDAMYTEEEQLVVYVESQRDVYLKLDYFQADGSVVHMVPNMFRGQAFIRKGKTYTFGGAESPERFVISGPFGEEVIKAVVSTQPFVKELETQEEKSDSRAYVETLRKGLEVQSRTGRTRGLKILSGASAALFTTSREVLHHKEAIGE